MAVEKAAYQVRIVSVNAGRIRTSVYRNRDAVSGIFKQPVSEAVAIGPQGVSGDEVADLVNHGGPDKAVCVYSHVHYPRWEGHLGLSMPYGAFGENLTLEGLREEDVRIGDVFRVGTAVVQISQPRIPCWKLAMKWGDDKLPELVAKSGATGFYFRVLEPGTLRKDDLLIRETCHPAGVTVAEANRVMHRDKHDLAGIRMLLDLRGVLADSWIVSLENRWKRLNGEA